MSSELIIKSLLSQQAHFQVNKQLIKKLGLDEAALLSILVDGDKQFHFVNDGWFYTKASYIQEVLNIGRKPYDSALKNLVNCGIVNTRVAGCPPTTHFKLNYDMILEYCVDDGQFVQNGQINLPETDKLNCPECTIPYNKEINNKEHNNTPLSPKRGNNKKTDVVDYSFIEPEFVPIMQEWYKYKKEKKQKYTDRGWRQCYAKLMTLSNGNPDTAIDLINEAMANNWSGFFEKKNGSQSQSSAIDDIQRRTQESMRVAYEMMQRSAERKSEQQDLFQQ